MYACMYIELVQGVQAEATTEVIANLQKEACGPGPIMPSPGCQLHKELQTASVANQSQSSLML